jgi:hypothetical protein
VCNGKGEEINVEKGTDVQGEACKECDENGDVKNKEERTDIQGKPCKECKDGGENNKTDGTVCTLAEVEQIIYGRPDNDGIKCYEGKCTFFPLEPCRVGVDVRVEDLIQCFRQQGIKINVPILSYQ